MLDRYDAIIAGGGFAGASTAWWLKRGGMERILILEQENLPGTHASGKNAGIARQAINQEPVCTLATRSVSFIRNPPVGFTDSSLIDRSGGFLVSTRENDPELETLIVNSESTRLSCRRSTKEELFDAAPILGEIDVRDVLYCPDDGLVDIGALLASYLKNIKVLTDARITGIETEGHLVKRIKSTAGNFETEFFIDAAGAWAQNIAEMAGAKSIKIEPRRRHLLQTAPDGTFAKLKPYLWFTEPSFYFRPESGGLLLSSCDETTMPPCTPRPDDRAPSWLYKKIRDVLPSLLDIPISRFWCELRCFTPDSVFLIGPHPDIENFFFVCGLGGHGMTTSGAVGEMAADLILGKIPALDPAPFSPSRFR